MKHAIVNGVEISGEAVQFELDRLVRFYMGHGMTMDEIKQNLPKLEEKALEQAIGAKLLLDRASELDVPVTGADIDAEVAKVVMQVGGEENFKKALGQQGITEVQFRKELEKGAKVNKLVEQACAGVPDPTEDEVAKFYEQHKQEFATPPQVLCQHILVKGSDDAALDKITSIRERSGSGKSDFAAEAKEHSDCPSGAEGGSLGWFGRGMMVPE
ncbi:MAG: SurA N-terminal domain-containing protein, partial [bacterium]|nr:SurA N-terminal domain-containing protein [Candidatus Colisoma equi]